MVVSTEGHALTAHHGQSASRHHISHRFLPNPNSSSFQRQSSKMNIRSGCPLFVKTNLSSKMNIASGCPLFVLFETLCLVDWLRQRERRIMTPLVMVHSKNGWRNGNLTQASVCMLRFNLNASSPWQTRSDKMFILLSVWHILARGCNIDIHTQIGTATRCAFGPTRWAAD